MIKDRQLQIPNPANISADDILFISINNEIWKAQSIAKSSFNQDTNHYLLVNKAEDLAGLSGVFPTQMFYYLASILAAGPYEYQVTKNVTVTISDHPVVKKHMSQNSVLVLEPVEPQFSADNKYTVVQLSPNPTTLLDVSRIGKVTIKRPGIMDLEEINQLLPIPLIKEFDYNMTFDEISKKDLAFDMFDAQALIIAPKELISLLAPETSHQFFQTSFTNGKELFNIGSINSPQTLLKNLYRIPQLLKENKIDAGLALAVVWIDSGLDYINEAAYAILHQLENQFGLKSIKVIKSWKTISAISSVKM